MNIRHTAKKHPAGFHSVPSAILAMAAIGFILFAGATAAEVPDSREARKAELEQTAREIAEASPARAKERIRGMDLSTAMAVYDLLVRQAGEKGVEPQVFYAAEQIQLLKATEDSQKRLESLIWVIALTLVLFAGYLTYVLFDQRRIYRKLSAMDKKVPNAAVAEGEVYRGE